MVELKKAIGKFSKILETRLVKDRRLISEDWIRYAFYESLLSEFNISPEQVYLELLYSSDMIKSDGISGKCKLDALVDLENAKYAFELKFLRKSKRSDDAKKSDTALSSSVGLLINDILRLNCINNKEIERFLVYIVDERFASYLNNKLDSFFRIKEGNDSFLIDSTFIENGPCETFKKKARKSVSEEVECKVECIYSYNYESRFYLRVLRVLRLCL